MKAKGEFTGQKGRHREVWSVQGSMLSQRWRPRRLSDNPLEYVGKGQEKDSIKSQVRTGAYRAEELLLHPVRR